MGALAYLEFKYALHRAQAILRSPVRLLVWIPYVAFVGYFAYARSQHHQSSAPSVDIVPSYLTLMVGGYVALIGSSVAFSAGGRVAGFRSPAEALILSNARLRPLTIVLWLQLRKIAASPMRWIGGFVYLFAVAAPKDASIFVLIRALVVVSFLIGIAMGVELPAFLLARGRMRIVLQTVGWALAIAGGAYAVCGFLGERVLGPVDAFTHVDPGALGDALLAGNYGAVAAIAFIVAALGASVLLLGDDALPELYAASLGVRANRARRARTSPSSVYEVSKRAASGKIPDGSLTLVWKDWIAFRRGRGTMRLWMFGALGWLCCGIAVGVAKIAWSDPTPIFTLAAGSLVLVLVLAPFNASVGLANDLSKPLFWLNAAPLRTCMLSWTAARSWRGGIVLGLAPMAAGIVIENLALVLAAVPLALAVNWSLQALGVGLYALFPDPIDARGPMLLFRLFITCGYILPAALAYGVGSLFPGYEVLGAVAAIALLVSQGYGIIELATYRFREYGATLATISRAT